MVEQTDDKEAGNVRSRRIASVIIGLIPSIVGVIFLPGALVRAGGWLVLLILPGQLLWLFCAGMISSILGAFGFHGGFAVPFPLLFYVPPFVFSFFIYFVIANFLIRWWQFRED